jgi:hypothetical protein
LIETPCFEDQRGFRNLAAWKLIRAYLFTQNIEHLDGILVTSDAMFQADVLREELEFIEHVFGNKTYGSIFVLLNQVLRLKRTEISAVEAALAENKFFGLNQNSF